MHVAILNIIIYSQSHKSLLNQLNIKIVYYIFLLILHILIKNLEDEVKSIKNCKSILNKLNMKYDHAYNKTNFSCIIERIKKL